MWEYQWILTGMVTPWVSVLPPWLLVIYHANPPELTIFTLATPEKKKIDKKHVLPKIVIVHILPYMTFHISILVLPWNPRASRHLQRHLQAAARGPRHFSTVLGKHRQHHLVWPTGCDGISWEFQPTWYWNRWKTCDMNRESRDWKNRCAIW
jgi:hypothetical protein